MMDVLNGCDFIADLFSLLFGSGVISWLWSGTINQVRRTMDSFFKTLSYSFKICTHIHGCFFYISDFLL